MLSITFRFYTETPPWINVAPSGRENFSPHSMKATTWNKKKGRCFFFDSQPGHCLNRGLCLGCCDTICKAIFSLMRASAQWPRRQRAPTWIASSYLSAGLKDTSLFPTSVCSSAALRRGLTNSFRISWRNRGPSTNSLRGGVTMHFIVGS